MLKQHIIELTPRHRLYKIAVKSCIVIKLDILSARICRQYDYRHMIIKSSVLSAYTVITFDAVHFRHEMVHENDIIAVP